MLLAAAVALAGLAVMVALILAVRVVLVFNLQLMEFSDVAVVEVVDIALQFAPAGLVEVAMVAIMVVLMDSLAA
jgi:hypothetical protein